MGTPALIATAKTPRAFYAAGLLAALLGALLGAWFFSGWQDVRTRQRDLGQAPRLAAEQRAHELAGELHAELEGLVAREWMRPYFHYQNLMHDPKSSAEIGVSPSPLAGGSRDKFVLGYFQLDTKGRTTTPTINDEVPELSERENVVANRAFREHVARDLTRQLAPVAKARATPAPTRPVSRPPESLPQLATAPASQQSQMIAIERNTYSQNQNPNAVYSQQEQAPNSSAIRQQAPASPVDVSAPAPVTITISPLEWHTSPFAGVQTLVAVRQIETPDGALTQGFVVDQSQVRKWLASKAGDMVADLRPDDSRGAVVAPHWGLTVEPSSRSIAQAADEAGAVARSFVLRFVAVSAVAVLTAGFVLLFVTRAEKLARQRSQFAAAAAHELRTPLAGLQLYGDMLADGLGDPAKTRDYARRISEDAARLGRVVSNMLGLSELERGNLSVHAEIGPVGDVLSELAERARPGLERAGASLEVDVATNLFARFDRDALTRIVGNLVDNAEKYARGAGDRTIRLAAADRGDVVEVRVEDRGPGISDKTKLFRAFSRGVNGPDNPAGLGLGLALSKSLARAMGGDLAYHGRDGGGATFVLQLPRE